MTQSINIKLSALENKLCQLIKEGELLEELILEADRLLNMNTVSDDELIVFRQKILSYVTVYRAEVVEC